MRDRRGRDSRESPGGERVMVGLYRWALRLLPPRVRAEDGEEMVWVFRALWRDARSRRARVRLALKTFTGLAWAIVLEWKEAVGGQGQSLPRSERGVWSMSSWSNNLRLAFRSLRRAPSFTATTVLLLGLGIGSVTTMFTVVDHVVLRSLPYPASDRLIQVENGSHPGPVFRAFQEKVASVELWGATRTEEASLVGEDDPLRVRQTEVSRDYFDLYGARPGLGRLFVEDDYRAADVAVLAHGAWERIFGSDPHILGRTIRLDGKPLTVVGVLDEDFAPPEGQATSGGSSSEIWRPLDWNDENLARISYWVLEVTGRVAPGRTLEDVNGELEQVSQDLARQYPEDRVDRDGAAISLPASRLQEVTTRRVRGGLELLLGAVGLLLMVACLNVAHLFLARGLGRARDMAVRRALGAGTSSLVQQLLVESLVLGSAGLVVGLGLAGVGLKSFLSLNPSALPWASEVSVDLRVAVFASGVALLTVLLFGLIPALRSVGADITRDLSRASRSSTPGRSTGRMRSGLVVLEVALSLVLVAESGLLLRSFARLQAGDPGFQVEGLWTVPLSPTAVDTPEEYREAMNRVEASLASVPGVVSATYGLSFPFQFTGEGRCCWTTGSVQVDGETLSGHRVFLHAVTESWFETLRLPLVAGRSWTRGEANSDPWPVVLSEGLAVRLFGSAERAMNRGFAAGRDSTFVRVVGVARDDRHYGLDQEYEDAIYLPMEHLPFSISLAGMLVRVQGDPPAGFARSLRKAVWAALPDLPVPTVRPMEGWVQASTAGRRFDSVLFGAFGAMALLLAAAGLYGTLLYNVGQRRREVGIRIALGAARSHVERRVVVGGLVLTAVGCALGLLATLGTGRFLESRLFGLTPTDPGTLSLAVGVLLASALVASWVPARRAARVDPMEVLRED